MHQADRLTPKQGEKRQANKANKGIKAMMNYKVCFFESSVSMVKTGQCMPFETFQTSSYENARKSCLEFTTDDHNCSAVLVNQETGNRIYFQDGQEKA